MILGGAEVNYDLILVTQYISNEIWRQFLDHLFT